MLVSKLTLLTSIKTITRIVWSMTCQLESIGEVIQN